MTMCATLLSQHKAIGLRVITTRMLVLCVVTWLVSGCALSEFKPRAPVVLSALYDRVYITGIDKENALYRLLKESLRQQGSAVVDDKQVATATITLSDYSENKQVAAYGAKREVRQYLIRLKFNYQVERGGVSPQTVVALQTINLDKTQLYDSEYVLGKIDEEEVIRQLLRKDAVRLVMLRLQHNQK